MIKISESDIKSIVACSHGNDSTKIRGHKIEPFASEKCGVLSDQFSLIVEIDDKQDGNANNRVKVDEFFVKSLGDRKKLPKFVDEDSFEEEMNFYNKIIPLMVENYHGKKWHADCYLAKNDVIVLEDLRQRNFTVPKDQTMDVNTMKSATATLACFHACTILAEVKLGKPMNEAFPKFFTEKICNKNNKFGRVMTTGHKTQVLMAEKLNIDASFVVPRVYNYISEIVKPQKNHLNVICHSDLYKFNIMFNDEKDAILLDYQLLRYASPLIDVSMLLYLNTTPEFRKEFDMDILKHYYTVFQNTLDQHGISKIPSYKEMLKMYHKCKIVGMSTAVDYLSSLYLNNEKLRFKIWNNAEVCENYLISSRIEYLGPELERDPVYAKKMKSIMREYLAEAKRVLKL